MSYISDLEDDREDRAAMYARPWYMPNASYKQIEFVKSLLSQKCLNETDFAKNELPDLHSITTKRADRLIKRGKTRQKKMLLVKAKEASCF
jgi:hypothetical protein